MKTNKQMFCYLFVLMLSPIFSYAQWSTTGNASTSASTNYVGTSDNVDLVFRTNATEKVRIKADGGVGIATTCIPTGYKLAVDGKIMCEELQVKMSNGSGCWPDYVFADSYQLMTLQELEKFIKENNHLPGVPAQEQVEAEGISTSEMFRIQMEKIEELSLYMIELNKQMEILKAENQTLKNQLNNPVAPVK